MIFLLLQVFIKFHSHNTLWNFLFIFCNCTPLYLASSEGRVTIVELLLENPNIDVNAETYDPIITFCIFNDISHCELFMKFFFTFFYYTPLHYAVEKGYLPIVRLLLKNPNIEVNCKTICFFFFF